MSVYSVVRYVEDIDVAVKALIDDAVEKATEDMQEEYDRRLDEAYETIEELRTMVRELQQELMSE